MSSPDFLEDKRCSTWTYAYPRGTGMATHDLSAERTTAAQSPARAADTSIAEDTAIIQSSRKSNQNYLQQYFAIDV